MRMLRHAWTCLLVVGSGLFLVILPYNAIIRCNVLFWAVVMFGLVVSFICAASETAFALACGEDQKSPRYKMNLDKQIAAIRIYDSTEVYVTGRIRESAKRRKNRLDTLLKIGFNFKGYYNPVLVVVNNVAIIFVTVVSGLAQFSEPTIAGAHDICHWLVTQDHPLGCINIGRISIPFPVSVAAFQSAFALTLILIIGEIIPKQIACAFPSQVAEALAGPVSKISFLSLGTGPSFGAVGEAITNLASRILTGRRKARYRARMPRSVSAHLIPSESQTATTTAVICDGFSATFGHPRIFLTVESGQVRCPYCSREFGPNITGL